MINAKRLFGYLATGAMPEMTALDVALRRNAVLAAAMDAIDFAAHDMRYHGGQFDPKTMQCGMRQALEHGDLADVLAAERQELLDDECKRREINARNKAKHKWQKELKLEKFEVQKLNATTVPELRRKFELHNKDPRELSEAEFNELYGKCNDACASRLKETLKRIFVPSKQSEYGTVIGVAEGRQVTAHKKLYDEFVNSKNSQWHRAKDKDGWKSKVRMVRDFSRLLSTAHDSQIREFVAHNDRHNLWMGKKGVQHSVVIWEGNEWTAIFFCPSEDHLLLYDVVRFEPIKQNG